MRRSARGIPVAEELAWAIVQRNPHANKHLRNSTRTAPERSAYSQTAGKAGTGTTSY